MASQLSLPACNQTPPCGFKRPLTVLSRLCSEPPAISMPSFYGFPLPLGRSTQAASVADALSSRCTSTAPKLPSRRPTPAAGLLRGQPLLNRRPRAVWITPVSAELPPLLLLSPVNPPGDLLTRRCGDGDWLLCNLPRWTHIYKSPWYTRALLAASLPALRAAAASCLNSPCRPV